MRKRTETEQASATFDSLQREHGAHLPSTTAAGFSGGSVEELPAHVTAARVHGALQISVRQTNGSARWISFIIAFVLAGVVSYSWIKGSPLVLWSAMLPFFLYSAAKDFLNRTTLTVDHRKIVIKRGPVRIRGREELLASEEIKQMFVHQVTRGRGSNRTTSFTLTVEMRDRRRIDVVTDLDDAHQGEVIKEQIERELEMAGTS